ncbi:MAG: hypothetical protein IJ644_00200 [Oscillospiraceae bacterium]|nr:hypothetical protein [Oscillospiraceae bacterium]
MNEKYEFPEEWSEEEQKDWNEKMSEPIQFKKLTAEDVQNLKSQRKTA